MQPHTDMKIGFFDSGLGGLVVLKAVAKRLPDYDYEFYGDTAHLPYGDKTETEIYELTKQGAIHLFERNCVLVILACNTASAETLRRLQDEWLPVVYPDRKILGVIIPMVEEVVASDSLRVMLIATKRTIESQKYNRELAKFTEAPYLHTLATPELVPLIESGNLTGAIQTLIPQVDAFLADGGTALILGCTHYTLLKPALREIYGERLEIFSPTEIIPKKLATYLEHHTEITDQLSQGSSRSIFLTEPSRHYDRIIGDLLGGHFLVDEDITD